MTFLDANYFLRFVVQPESVENQERHAIAAAVFAAAARDELEIMTPDVLIAEVTYVLGSPRQYGLSVADIVSRLRPILALPGIKHPHKERLLRALDVWESHPRLEETGLLLDTFDSDFDDIPGIRRWKPQT